MIIPPNPILGKQRRGQQNQKAQAFSLIIAAAEGVGRQGHEGKSEAVFSGHLSTLWVNFQLRCTCITTSQMLYLNFWSIVS